MKQTTLRIAAHCFSDHLVAAASWCLGFGSLGLLAAELSGQLIEDHVNRAAAGNILEVSTVLDFYEIKLQN
ncbi:MAG TPA: hypothetical protein DHV65_09190 [Ktedonobacter sp.]|nr:hypothetical protein [Ktedonobacter sp.]